MKGTPKVVFKREEIRSINNAWTECPFDKDQLKTTKVACTENYQLDEIFSIKKLKERFKSVQSFRGDVADNKFG